MLGRVTTGAAPDAAGVVAAFGLPGSPTMMTEVRGGWSNRVWHLSTTRGDYAVKELRNAWGEPRWREWLDEGWRVERAAIHAGVAAPEPVPAAATGGVVGYVGRTDASGAAPVRLHRWVEASPVPREPVDLDLARWVGRTLAGVHALRLRPVQADLYPGRAGLTRFEVWPDLVERSFAARAPWTAALAAGEPVARRASGLLVPWDPADEVLCHGDIDQQNLLRAVGGPVLCDWDVVLPRLPAHDLAQAALSMASWRSAGAASAVLDGYRDAGGEVGALEPADLAPCLASRLGWIRFSVDRALQARLAGVAAPDGPDIAALVADLEHRLAVATSAQDWLGRG